MYENLSKNKSLNFNLNGVGISEDGGMTFKYMDCQAQTDARYGAFPSKNMFVVASGNWPNNADLIDADGNYHLSKYIRLPTGAAPVKRRSVAVSSGENNSTGWMAQITVSNDGGNTWTSTFISDQFYFNDIRCPSTQVCFVAAENDDNAFIYVSTDGAKTWKLAVTDAGSSLFSAWATSATEFWVAGGNMNNVVGHAWHSTDSGNTWTLTTANDAYFLAISFPRKSGGIGYGAAINVYERTQMWKFSGTGEDEEVIVAEQ